MTYKQFLAALKKTPRDWKVLPSGAIRRRGEQDPITSLERRPAMGRFEIAGAMHIPARTARAVGEAADSTESEILESTHRRVCRIRHLVKVRRDLLKACGLPAESGEKQ